MEKKSEYIFYLIASIFVIWIALLVAPYISGGIPSLIKNLGAVMDNPFNITWCENSLRTILIFLGIYAIGIGMYVSTKKNYRRQEEYGSGKWGDAYRVNAKYMQKPISENKILTQNVKLGLNGKKHRRNLNVLVCGGSGAGKTRFYCKPNIMQANTSFIILDPKGEILRDTVESITSSLMTATFITIPRVPHVI